MVNLKKMFENMSSSLYSSVLRERKNQEVKKRTLKGEINIKNYYLSGYWQDAVF